MEKKEWIIIVIICFIVSLIASVGLFDGAQQNNEVVTYSQYSIPSFYNITFEVGQLNLTTCELNFTGGLLVRSSCSNNTYNPMGLTDNYTFVTSIVLDYGVLTINTCAFNYTNGLLNSTEC